MHSQNVEALLHAYFNCPVEDYVNVARELAEADCLRLEDKQAIASSIVSVHALTILRHIDLIHRESA